MLAQRRLTDAIRFLVLALVCLIALPKTTYASQEGLLISPPRAYVSVDAGSTKTGTITVANLTEKTMHISTEVQRFSVNDYTYAQTFINDNQGWLSVDSSTIQLSPNKSATVKYLLSPPANTAPGGYYFSVVASTELNTNGVVSTMQAATLLYVTVNGTLSKTSQLEKSHIPFLVFGRTIPYEFVVKNTGNVHFFIYIESTLEGLFVNEHSTKQAHILLPDTSRSIVGNIDSPVLPGIYRVTYSYKTDSGQVVRRSRLIAYMPFWSFALLGITIIAVIRLNTMRSKRKTAKSD